MGMLAGEVGRGQPIWVNTKLFQGLEGRVANGAKLLYGKNGAPRLSATTAYEDTS